MATGFEKLGIDARPSVRHEQSAQLELRGPAGRQQDVGRPGGVSLTPASVRDIRRRLGPTPLAPTITGGWKEEA